MLTNQIHPTPEQLAQLQTYPKNTPVVMVNILKFKAKTASGETGQEAYARYFKNASSFVAKSGAKLVCVHTPLPHESFRVVESNLKDCYHKTSLQAKASQLVTR